MPIPITDKFKPAGVGGFALMDAEDVEMPDGSRLSDFNPVSSWNNLTDKPFGEEQAFEPIFIPEMLDESVSYDLSQILGDGMVFYKIRTPILDEGAYEGAIASPKRPMNSTYTYSNSIETGIAGIELHRAQVDYEETPGEFVACIACFILVVHVENEFGIPVGVYGAFPVLTATGCVISKEIIDHLDEKYLPMEAIDQRIEKIAQDIVPNVMPSGAQIGQSIRVAAVDENGNITALEAVTVASDIIFMTAEEYAEYRNSDEYDPNQVVAICREGATGTT